MTNTQQWVAMGYIKGVLGIKGWVKISTNTEYADSLLDYPEWQLRKDGKTFNVTIESGKIANDQLQVKFKNIDNREDASLLRGYTIEIQRQNFPDTEQDEYYWTDLVGLNVINRNDILLGKISKIIETGAHDVLVIDGKYGQKLIPFVSHYIDNVDIAGNVIIADWDVDY